MEKNISQRVAFIRKIRDEHGLSAEKIGEIVSYYGEYVSITTIRRVIAKNAETKRFRIDTVEPIYNALLTKYGENTPSKPCVFNFAGFDREKYESLISSLKDTNTRLREQVETQSKQIDRQAKMIEILWHGLQTDSEEERQAVVNYFNDKKE